MKRIEKYINDISDVTENTLSEDEYIILKNINKKWKWIVRDGYCNLTLYKIKPTKGISIWNVNQEDYTNYINILFDLFDNLFQFIKWKNNEPFSIEKLIQEYEDKHRDER